MTVFTIDTSHHDSDRRGAPLDWAKIRAAGIVAMCAKLTEGDPEGYDYTDPTGPLNIANARAAGFTLAGGYHCLSRGDSAGIARQVDWLWSRIRATGATWAMLDVEPFQELKDRGITPRFSDVTAFVNRWRAVTSMPIAVYLPRWYWSQLGSPSLAGLTIVSSDYGDNADGTYADLYRSRGGDSGRGWGSYGGVTPALWQYSSNANVPGASDKTDVNAFRGSLAELTALLTGDDMTITDDDIRRFWGWRVRNEATLTADQAQAWVTLDQTIENTQKALSVLAQLQANVAALAGKDWVDEQAIVSGVLAGLSALTPEAIANQLADAFPADVAAAVVAVLGAKLTAPAA